MTNGNIQIHRRSFGRRLLDHWQVYLLLLPAFVITLLFKYVPLYGVQLAFKSMKLGQTIETARWVGWSNFERFFHTGAFSRTMINTLCIGVATVLTFPLPLILALLLHNCVSPFTKKFAQTVTYIPYLVSVTVTISILMLFCNGSTGFINIVLKKMGLESIAFLGEDKYVLPLYILSEIWSKTGYNSVIYLAALASVNEELIDASMIDGCSKLKRIWYIDVPAILPTIVTLLIMNMGTFFAASVDKMLLLQTDLNIAASETIGTYTYKLGFVNRQYGYSAAVDLFTNVVNFGMLLLSNFIARRVSDSSLF